MRPGVVGWNRSRPRKDLVTTLYRDVDFYARADALHGGSRILEAIGFSARRRLLRNVSAPTSSRLSSLRRPSAEDCPIYDNYRGRGRQSRPFGDACAIARRHDACHDDSQRRLRGRAECPYDEEFDGNDFSATHLIGYVGDEPAGCLAHPVLCRFRKDRTSGRSAASFARRASRSRSCDAGDRTLPRQRISADLRARAETSAEFLEPVWLPAVRGRPRVRLLRLRLRRDRARHDAHPKAISIGVDPYIMIRPEGRWHVPGILERSAIGRSRVPRSRSKQERARA